MGFLSFGKKKKGLVRQSQHQPQSETAVQQASYVAPTVPSSNNSNVEDSTKKSEAQVQDDKDNNSFILLPAQSDELNVTIMASNIKSMTSNGAGDMEEGTGKASGDFSTDIEVVGSNAPMNTVRSRQCFDGQPSLLDNPSMVSRASAFTFQRDEKTLETMSPTFETRDSSSLMTARNGGMANSHLVMWQYSAEEGPCLIRLTAMIASLVAIGTTIFPIITMTYYWSIPVIMAAFHVVLFCMLILLLDSRSLGILRDPNSYRATLCNYITHNVRMLKYVWGRGLLYIFTGCLNLTVDYVHTLESGLVLIAIGSLALVYGSHSSSHYNSLRKSLADESHIWEHFGAHDTDSDGMIDMSEFAALIWSLGLELNDTHVQRAFEEIDFKQQQKVTFEGFLSWWMRQQ